MIQLVIFADDFTGAVDTGVQFSKQGISTLVTLDRSLDIAESTAEVLIVDVESRHISPQEAYQRVYSLVKKAQQMGVRNFYKKTDSTLRGNIGSELSALLDASGEDVLVFVPAFPKLQRTTHNGIQYVDGISLDKTAFAKDPFTPVPSGYVPDIIHAQSQVDTVLTVVGEIDDVLEHRQNPAVVVMDAQTDRELERIGHELGKRTPPVRLMAGCAGFAGHLSKVIPFHQMEKQQLAKAERLLVVCGSLNTISLNQARYAERLDHVRSHAFTAKQKTQDGYVNTPEGQTFTEMVAGELRQPGTVILKSVALSKEDESFVAAKGSHVSIAANMGSIACSILEHAKVDLLVVFGGDTLFGIVSRMNCRAIIPQVEILPGIVQAKLICESGTVQVVTKAGGFGDENSLAEIIRAYRGSSK